MAHLGQVIPAPVFNGFDPLTGELPPGQDWKPEGWLDHVETNCTAEGLAHEQWGSRILGLLRGEANLWWHRQILDGWLLDPELNTVGYTRQTLLQDYNQFKKLFIENYFTETSLSDYSVAWDSFRQLKGESVVMFAIRVSATLLGHQKAVVKSTTQVSLDVDLNLDGPNGLSIATKALIAQCEEADPEVRVDLKGPQIIRALTDVARKHNLDGRTKGARVVATTMGTTAVRQGVIDLHWKKVCRQAEADNVPVDRMATLLKKELKHLIAQGIPKAILYNKAGHVPKQTSTNNIISAIEEAANQGEDNMNDMGEVCKVSKKANKKKKKGKVSAMEEDFTDDSIEALRNKFDNFNKDFKGIANYTQGQEQKKRPPLSPTQCAFCRKEGHWVRNCPTKQQADKTGSQAGNA